MTTSNTLQFTFNTEELPDKLLASIEKGRTGIWHFQILHPQTSWYLGVVQGRIIFAGKQTINWNSFVEGLQRFLYKLRKESAHDILSQVQQDNDDDEVNLGANLIKLEKQGVVSHQEVVQASLLNILSYCDDYLFDLSGKAEFIPDESLIYRGQIPGFKVEDILARATQRRIKWRLIKQNIYSPQCTLNLDTQKLAESGLTPIQKKQIETLFTHGNTLEEMAYNLAKDTLEIAKICSKLTDGNIITASQPEENQEQKPPLLFVVDDSSLLVQRFSNLVINWGYRVESCLDASQALDKMLETSPDLLFLDINMPKISGFELIKLIRRQKTLASIPIVMLTGEKSVSNKWRAQWANCKFLTKPVSQEEVKTFRQELKTILQELAPLPTATN
jgi:CheY-like chemotaxis protein